MLWGWGYDKEWIIIHEYEQKINLKRNIHIYDKWIWNMCMYVKMNQMTRAAADEGAMLWGWGYNEDGLLGLTHSSNCLYLTQVCPPPPHTLSKACVCDCVWIRVGLSVCVNLGCSECVLCIWVYVNIYIFIYVCIYIYIYIHIHIYIYI